MNKRILTIPFFLTLMLIFGVSAMAQNQNSIYYLENVPQSNFENPALIPRCNGYLGIPAASAFATTINTNIPINQLVQNTDSGWVTPLQEAYDYNKLYPKLASSVAIQLNQVITPLAFGFRVGRGYFNFAIAEKIKLRTGIPSDLFKVADKGGFPNHTTLDLSSFSLKAMYYREFSLGYAYQFSKKLTVGAHVKGLLGIVAAKSAISKFNIQTDTTLWNFDVKGDVYTSFPMDVYPNADGIPDSVIVRDLSTSDIIHEAVLNFSNPGFAVDLGAVYQLSEAWTFSAALNDLGGIVWRRNLNSFHFDGNYPFKGIDVNINNYDSINNAVQDLVDSIKTVIKFKSGSDKFSTGLNPKLNLGARYNVNYYFSVSALSHTVFDPDYFQQDFSLGANLNLYHVLTLNLNYNLNIYGVSNVGLGLGLRGGPVQFYLAADHIPFTYRQFKLPDQSNKIPVPYKFSSFNLMFGFNFIFGPNGYQDEPMIDAYSEF